MTNPTPTPGRPVRIISPEINPDHAVTFRLRAPEAREVSAEGDWEGGSQAMIKDASTGVWSVTLNPLPPGLYGYSFRVDGLYTVDPANRLSKPARHVNTSLLEIPGEPPLPWERNSSVPKGTVTLHDYDSEELGLRRLRVYTPPGYETEIARDYPVLYLLHGSGDNEATWTEFGRANVILDNLIAAGICVPMVVGMTDGHASWPGQVHLRSDLQNAFEQDLLESVIPLVESRYRTRTDRESRAIAGLSMGGNQSLTIGLNHQGLFAWICGMSSALRDVIPLEPFFASRESGAAQPVIRLLWLKVGVDDWLLEHNRQLTATFTERGVVHEYTETEGGHIWPVWRKDLVGLVPRLFV